MGVYNINILHSTIVTLLIYIAYNVSNTTVTDIHATSNSTNFTNILFSRSPSTFIVTVCSISS